MDFKDLEGRTLIHLNILSCFISDIILSLGIRHIDVGDSIKESVGSGKKEEFPGRDTDF